MTTADKIRKLFDAGVPAEEIQRRLGVTRQAIVSAHAKRSKVGRPRKHTHCQSCGRPYEKRGEK